MLRVNWNLSLSSSHNHRSHLSRCLIGQHNMPEEDDETMSAAEQQASVVSKPDSSLNPGSGSTLPERVPLSQDSLVGRQRLEDQLHVPPGPSYFSYQPSRSLPAGFSQPTPFPSQASGPWIHSSFASSWSQYPSSLPSYLNHKDYSSCAGDSCLSGCKPLSLPGSHGSSLEQPMSLCSNPPSANMYHHTLSPYACSPQGAACFAQCHVDAFTWRPRANKLLMPQCPPPNGTCCKSGTGRCVLCKSSKR